jgi:hypothetical protein
MTGTVNDIDDADDSLPEFSEEERAYLLSDAGIALMMRTISDEFGNWHRCPVKRCRRARRCQGPDMVCQLKAPSRRAPLEEIARANARMRQVVERRLEQLGIW